MAEQVEWWRWNWSQGKHHLLIAFLRLVEVEEKCRRRTGLGEGLCGWVGGVRVWGWGRGVLNFKVLGQMGTGQGEGIWDKRGSPDVVPPFGAADLILVCGTFRYIVHVYHMFGIYREVV